jgi:hypothetical protein
MATKKCTKCEEIKDLNEFSLRGGTTRFAQYHKSECKVCCSKRTAYWVDSNRDRHNANQLRNAKQRYWATKVQTSEKGN